MAVGALISIVKINTCVHLPSKTPIKIKQNRIRLKIAAEVYQLLYLLLGRMWPAARRCYASAAPSAITRKLAPMAAGIAAQSLKKYGRNES